MAENPATHMRLFKKNKKPNQTKPKKKKKKTPKPQKSLLETPFITKVCKHLDINEVQAHGSLSLDRRA